MYHHIEVEMGTQPVKFIEESTSTKAMTVLVSTLDLRFNRLCVCKIKGNSWYARIFH